MSSKNKTGISWAKYTWNILAGCEKVSSGCKNCYAMKVAYDAASKGVKKYEGLTKMGNNGIPVWNGEVKVARERVWNDPMRIKEPSIIFVNSMSDLFYEKFDKDIIFKALDKMMEINWHKYLILTKREDYMKKMVDIYCNERGIDNLPDFIWCGVSVENDGVAKKRITALSETRCLVKFVSMEPLIGEVDLTGLPVLDWYIVGGESVERNEDPLLARPFDLNWARKIRDYCKENGVAFHMKQIGCNPVGAKKVSFKGDTEDDIPEDLKIREYPN